MPTVTPKFVFKFMQSRVEAVAQTLVGSIRIEMPASKALSKSAEREVRGAVDAVVAKDVLLSIRPNAGAGAPTFLHDLPSRVGDGVWSVVLPNLSAGASHWLLFEIDLEQPPDSALSRRRVAEIELAWSPTLPGKGVRRTGLNADVEMVNRVLVEPPDQEIEQQRALLLGGRSRG